MVTVSTRAWAPCYDEPREVDLIHGDGREEGVDHTAVEND
jgi:hypothetical protein